MYPHLPTYLAQTLTYYVYLDLLTLYQKIFGFGIPLTTQLKETLFGKSSNISPTMLESII